jgi:lipopolysaccharide/colanic/teichoic acid biosynthesis glycosyltransferase
MTPRLLDRSLALAGLLVASVPLTLAAAAIKLTSRGPVFYRQERIGRYGHPFRLYKLRTMYTGTAGARVTVAQDVRVTPLGRVLRRTKLDEIPQLWNIVRGDMAVIGPRPEVERFVRRYTADERRILTAMPGLASRAQVVYPHEADLLRESADPEEDYATKLMPEKIAVDLAYEGCRTIWTDLALMAELALMVAGVRWRIDRELRIQPPPPRPDNPRPGARTTADRSLRAPS